MKTIEQQVEEFIDAWSQSGWMDLAAGADLFIPSLIELIQERDRIARKEERAKCNYLKSVVNRFYLRPEDKELGIKPLFEATYEIQNVDMTRLETYPVVTFTYEALTTPLPDKE